MKRLLLVVLVALGLQTQAQITCDSITTTYLSITQDTIKVETNSMNLGIPFAMHSWDLYEGGWNGILTHYDTNVVASIPLPSPNLVDTFILCNWSDYGAAPYACYSCDTFAWNNGWQMLSQQIQEPTINCDSVEFEMITNAWPNSILMETNLNTLVDTSVFWFFNYWEEYTTCGTIVETDTGEIFTAQAGVSGNGTLEDTLIICLTTTVYDDIMPVGQCNTCDTVIWDGINWVFISQFNPTTSITEIEVNNYNDNKMYDLLGREITDVPVGTMYIKNGKKYIKTRY